MTILPLLAGLTIPLYLSAGTEEPQAEPIRVQVQWARVDGSGTKADRYARIMGRKGIVRLDAPPSPPLVARQDATGRWIIEHAPASDSETQAAREQP